MAKTASFSRQKWFILSTTSLGVFMATLDASIINIAMPQIASYYRASLGSVEWVVLVYLLLISSLLLTYGRLGDMYGHKPVYLSGFAIFTLGSVLNSVAPDIGSLIAYRAVQALGGGMILAVVQAIIADNFEPSERGRAIGLNAMFVSLGLAAGPTIGGILTSHFGWQSIFLINIPVGLVGISWAWRVLPYRRGKPQRFDLAGALTTFTGLMALLLALSFGEAWGWLSLKVLSLFVLSVCSFSLFLVVEKSLPYPMLRLELFKNRLFWSANLAAVFNYLSQYAVVFLMPFYLQNFLQMPANQAGLIMTAFPLVMMLTAPVSGILSDQMGSRTLASLGMGITAAAALVLSMVYLTKSLMLIVLGLAMVGLGTGLFLSPNNNAIMSSVPKNQAGIGSGMLATVRNLGQVLGVAVSGAVFSSRLSYYTAKLQAGGYDLQVVQNRSFVWAIRDAYLVAMAVAILGTIISLSRGNGAASKAAAKEAS